MSACLNALLIQEVLMSDHGAGFPSHNIKTNPAKTQLSFALDHAGMSLARTVHTAADGSEWIKWCGLLVNVASLQIWADYTRYAGRPLSDALTLPLAQVSVISTHLMRWLT